MIDEKKTVKLWNRSWFNLLYAMKMNVALLNDRQYYTTFKQHPEGSGNYHITSKHARINTEDILNEIAKQLKMTEPLKEAIAIHRRIEETLKSGQVDFSAEEVRKLEAKS